MFKNLCIRESYTDKQGNEKTSWPVIGVLFEAKGKEYVKLHHIPGVLVHVFEPKKKEGAADQGNNNTDQDDFEGGL